MQRTLSRLVKAEPVIRISNATFYRQYPTPTQSEANPPLFSNLNFNLPSTSKDEQYWGVLGGSSQVRTAFLQLLRGQYHCFPPTARSYPYLANMKHRAPNNAIQYVGFDAERGNSSIRGAYLSARYESRREESDFLLKDYLLGNTELNPSEEPIHGHPSYALLGRVSKDLKLDNLLDLPVSNLSNGQTRRSRIAKALLASPELLLLDGPFMGLDVLTVDSLSSLLQRIARSQSPRVLLSLRPDEHLPRWLTHIVFLGDDYSVDTIGSRRDVLESIEKRRQELYMRPTKEIELTPEEASFAELARQIHLNSNPVGSNYKLSNMLNYWRERNRKRPLYGMGRFKSKRSSQDGFQWKDSDQDEVPIGEPLVEMDGVRVTYGDRIALGDWTQDHDDGSSKKGLWWTIRRSQRWGVFGPNGSGKTTLTSLITSDHPQTYSLPIRLFGRSRLPSPGQPGISLFDIQSRIGLSSPEVHAFFPKHLSVRRTLESAWAEAPLSKVRLSFEIDEKISSALRWFQAELCPELGPTELQKEETLRASTFDVLEDNDSEDNERSPKKLPKLEKAWNEELRDPTALIWADERTFGSLSFSAQRVALFLRAIIRQPDLIILDEAFSGMDQFARDKCHLFLTHGENSILRFRKQIRRLIQFGPRGIRSDLNRLGLVRLHGLDGDKDTTGHRPRQALVVIAHREEEVPGCVRDWICLPEAGSGAPPRFGRLEGPLSMQLNGWRSIWGQPLMLAEKSSPEERLARKRALEKIWRKRFYSKERADSREARLANMRVYSKAWRARQRQMNGQRSPTDE